jgi:hypothetical protein
MSILDDAIREHLELKRAHGADEAELKRLEDEAFGPSGRPEEPDPFAEAPTEFMATPGVAEAVELEDGDSGGRRINIADLQEPPPEAAEREEARVEPAASIEPEAEATPIVPAEDVAQAAPPAEEPPVAEDDEAADRQTIAEQPTEFFDIEAEMGTEDAPAAEAPSPSDEEIAAAELSEPKLAPADPPTEIHASRNVAPAPEPLAEEDEEDEEFWSEQRLSDELDQALEAPLTEEHDIPAPPADEREAPAPTAEPSAPIHEDDSEEAPRPDYDPDTGHEDVLEDTPEFLEDAPEDDELWFEQRPPKDFDFDD